MPERKVIQPPQAPRPAGAYSPALLVAAVLAGARTTVGSKSAEGMLVEIAVIARIGLSG
jgi:hypothetical protein